MIVFDKVELVQGHHPLYSPRYLEPPSIVFESVVLLLQVAGHLLRMLDRVEGPRSVPFVTMITVEEPQ